MLQSVTAGHSRRLVPLITKRANDFCAWLPSILGLLLGSHPRLPCSVPYVSVYGLCATLAPIMGELMAADPMDSCRYEMGRLSHSADSLSPLTAATNRHQASPLTACFVKGAWMDRTAVEGERDHPTRASPVQLSPESCSSPQRLQVRMGNGLGRRLSAKRRCRSREDLVSHLLPVRM
ncbi:hypothetical protein VTK73DRAFT_8211 [Phialemonium thermophilum]|uniref:Uncharacterized protein n=1 Tax=Phialemonium thermophilum TaxID=223376 RepID=A0ABR3W9M1_9PEZI